MSIVQRSPTTSSALARPQYCRYTRLDMRLKLILFVRSTLKYNSVHRNLVLRNRSMFAQSASLPDSGAEGSALLRLAFFGITTLLALLFIAGVYWSSIRTGIARSTAVRLSAVEVLASVDWIAVTDVPTRRGG